MSLTLEMRSQQFLEIASELGIDHTTYDPNMMAGGLAVLDYNNDGFEDLYFIGGRYADHLYQNNGNGTFTDVTTLMGIDALADRYTMGVVSGDLDNDGFIDIFVTTFKGEQNICLKNVNGHLFEDITEEAGFFGTKWSMAATMGDVDLDGDLDIFVSNFIDFSNLPFFNNITALEPNFLFENMGDWRFKGRNDIMKNALAGCTLVSCFTDVDSDTDPDLLVINDFGGRYTPNQLFVNEDSGQGLVERGESLSINDGIDGMGIAVGDVDDNGFLDYYITNIGDNLFYLGDEHSKFSKGHEWYNVNDGEGYSWGAFIADMDNDGYQDIFIGKGSISESIDFQSNKLYRFENGIDDFIDITVRSGLDNGDKARGVVYTDINNDGWLDIVVNNVRIREDNNDIALVYMNKGDREGAFLKIKLEGGTCSKTAYGTRVELYSGVRRQIREVSGGSSYCSNNSQVVHFGLSHAKIDSVVVHWAGGMVQRLLDLLPNSYYFLTEGKSPDIFQSNLTTSVAESKKIIKDYIIYPNPVAGKLILRFSEFSDVPSEVALINATCRIRLLSNTDSTNNIMSIDITVIPPGIYYLRIKRSMNYGFEKIVIPQ